MAFVVDRYEGVTLAHKGDLGIILWTGDATLAANRWLIEKVVSDMVSRYGSVVLLQVITSDSGVPGPEARAYVQDALKKQLATMRRMVSVPVGDSLKMSIIRTIMRGMTLISGRGGVSVVASTVAEGIDLLYERAGSDTPPRTETARMADSLLESGSRR